MHDPANDEAMPPREELGSLPVNTGANMPKVFITAASGTTAATATDGNRNPAATGLNITVPVVTTYVTGAKRPRLRLVRD